LWPWIEASVARRFAFAAVAGAAAAALHWIIYPLTQGRVTFIFFAPAIVLVTTIAGRWPGTLTAVIGLLNAAALKDSSAIWIPNSAEQIAMISSGVVSVLVILVGDYYRRISRRELSDVNELHELSTTLATLPRLPDQLKLILNTFANLHGAERGVITVWATDREHLNVAASLGLGPRALDELRKVLVDDGATSIACVDKTRVIVEDTETDARFEKVRELARAEGFRSVHSTPLFSRDNELLGALTLYFTTPHKPNEREIRLADICARKAAVFIERSRAEDLVSQRDRRFESVLEASGVPFIIFAPVRDATQKIVEFRWVFLNTAAAEIMRCKPVDCVGRKVSDTLPRAWDDRVRFEMYVDAIEKNEVRETERQSEIDGNHNWFHIIASPLEGDLAIWFADITQRKKQERELLEADRRKDEFLATLAHELRNPLAPIRQAASILRTESATDAQKRWSNNVIERQVQHMSLLLEDLLEVSRITHGTLQLRKQQSDLQSILSAAVETARPLIDERRHQLQIDVPDSLQINGDPLRLAQVLSNLLTNAAKYTNPQGRIGVSAKAHNQELVIFVEDSGIGISPDDLPKVFGMFAQVRSAQDHAAGGLGIGLALAKGIVELHGGRIDVSSAGSGKGSTFTVRLPGVSQIASKPTGSPEKANGHATPTKRILLADDNRDAAESLAIILRLEGHQVDLAHDGATALELFAARAPDIALLDIGMPNANGYDVARQIRAAPEGRDVLLIAITGWAQDSDKAQSRAAGFDHHLTKPIEPDALIGLIGS
jgi:PAS domain S-box-containing protein